MTDRSIKIIYQRDVIRSVLERWLDQYSHYKLDHKFPFGNTVEGVATALVALDRETCSEGGRLRSRSRMGEGDAQAAEGAAPSAMAEMQA